jgi:DNA-binding NarL/FixJ family response regulator
VASVTLDVVLGEDDFLVRQGVERILATQADLRVVASCADHDAVLTAVAEHRPQVVVTDVRMPPTMTDEGIRLAARVADARPEVGVVVLSQYDDPEYVLALLEGGSAGRAYLLKERVSDVDQLCGAIRTVAAGGSVVDPRVVESLVQARSRRSSPVASLTAREREVLAAMARGLNNQAIAEELVIGVRAVEKHINAIFAKLGISEEAAVHKRVLAVVTWLSDGG